MTDAPDFEARLEHRLRAQASLATRPFDAHAIARMASSTSGSPLVRLASPQIRNWLAWFVPAALLALLAGALILAGPGRNDLRSGGLLAIGRSDGLYLATADGSKERPIRDDGPYFQPAWSSDGSYFAVTAVTDADANDLLVFRSDGALVHEQAGVFDFRWLPGVHQLAITGAQPHLAVIGLDGGLPRDLVLPSGTEVVGAFDWAPDGATIVVGLTGALGHESGELWSISSRGDPPRRHHRNLIRSSMNESAGAVSIPSNPLSLNTF